MKEVGQFEELMSIVVFDVGGSGGDFLGVFRYSVFEFNAGNHR
jgi:hypothetical protein